MSARTITDIINAALGHVSETSILNASDNRPIVANARTLYAIVKPSLLQKHPWKWAGARTLLPAAADAPAFEWRYRYPLPADCLQVRQPYVGNHLRGWLDARAIPFEVEGRSLLCDAPPPLGVRYTRDVPADQMPPLFADALILMLAGRIAQTTTQRAGLAKTLLPLANEAIADLKLMDIQDASSDRPENRMDLASDDWSGHGEARYGRGERRREERELAFDRDDPFRDMV